MEAIEVDRQKRAIEREFIEAMNDFRIILAGKINAANQDLNLLCRWMEGELK